MKSLMNSFDFKTILNYIDNRVPDSGYECSHYKGKICNGCAHPTCNGPITDNFIIGTKDRELIEKIYRSLSDES